MVIAKRFCYERFSVPNFKQRNINNCILTYFTKIIQVLLLAMLSLIFINETYTKYTTELTGSSNDTIAKWAWTINNNSVECLELSKSNRFKIIKALNVDTNEEGLYLYDTKDNSAVKYDDSYIKIIQKNNQMLMYAVIFFASLTLLSLILLCTISKKKKKVKKDVPTVKEIDDKIEEIKNEMKDETDEEVYNILEDSKKSKKKK